MRLIELRLKNLNSLKGEWHIDFTNPAFINEGIFAITGQTGAGKTTILDAICLALYSYTPRLGKITGAYNEIMTRGTGECSAEVVIEINSKRYRCSWYQHRAHKKAKGNLLGIKHEIIDIEADKILEDSKSKTAPFIENLIGMDFHQFTRSIMLAQGDFTAFLKSDIDQRGAILEKITGTSIYGIISKNVHEKRRSELEVLNRLQHGLNGLTLLDPDEEIELKTTLQSQQSAQDKQQQLVDSLGAQIKWLESITELQSKRTTYQTDLEQARQAQQNFIFDSKRLEYANKALEIDSQYGQLITNRNTVNRLKGDRQALADQLPIQQANLELELNDLHISKERETNAANELSTALPKIAQARKLDSNIAQQEQILTDHRQRKQTLAAHIEQLHQEIEQHKKGATQAEIKLASMDKYLTNAPELTDLDTDIANFDSNCSRLKTLIFDNESLNESRLTHLNQLKQSQDDLAALELQQVTDIAANAQSREQIAILEQQRTLLIDTQSLASMRGEQEYSAHISTQIEHIDFKVQKLVEIETQSDMIAQALIAINDELTVLAKSTKNSELALKGAKDKRQDKQTQFNLRQRVATLEEYITELKDDYPCPLCGALEHPYGEHHPYLENETSQSQQLQAQIIELDTTIANCEQVLYDLRIEKATKANSLEQYNQQLTPLQEQSATLLIDIKGLIASICDAAHSDAMTTIIQPIRNLLADDDIEWAQTMLEQLSTIKAQLLTHRNKLRATLTQYEEITDGIAERSQSMKAFELRKQKLASDISEIGTAIKITSLQIESTDNTLSINFSELQTISTIINALINNYPAGKYAAITNHKAYIHQIDISIQNLQPLFDSIEQQTVLADSDYIQYIQNLRHQSSYLKTLKTDFNSFKDTEQTLKTTISRLNAQTETQQTQLNAESEELNELNALIEDRAKTLNELKQDRIQLFADKDCNEEESRLRTFLDTARTQQIAAQRQVDTDQQILAQLQQQQQQLAEQLSAAMTALGSQETVFKSILAAADFVDEVYFSASRLPINERNQLSQRQQHIEYTLKQAQTLLVQTEQLLNDKQANPLTTDDMNTLTHQQQQVTDENKQLIESIGGMRQQLKDNEDKKQNQLVQLETINTQKNKLKVWQDLHQLIGSSDGKLYRTFAQGLTFEVMIKHANTQLYKMSNRYLLIRDDNNPLELNVIDNYQGGEIRSTKNLSGGEGFIISLALALGLSQMASHNIRVDSLFLDEGFGTLDDESLDIALDTLTNLQQEGKLIGVISHVAALKERILTQIQVTKLSGGFSQISGQGCQKIAC